MERMAGNNKMWPLLAPNERESKTNGLLGLMRMWKDNNMILCERTGYIKGCMSIFLYILGVTIALSLLYIIYYQMRFIYDKWNVLYHYFSPCGCAKSVHKMLIDGYSLPYENQAQQRKQRKKTNITWGWLNDILRWFLGRSSGTKSRQWTEGRRRWWFYRWWVDPVNDWVGRADHRDDG